MPFSWGKKQTTKSRRSEHSKSFQNYINDIIVQGGGRFRGPAEYEALYTEIADAYEAYAVEMISNALSEDQRVAFEELRARSVSDKTQMLFLKQSITDFESLLQRIGKEYRELGIETLRSM